MNHHRSNVNCFRIIAPCCWGVLLLLPLLGLAGCGDKETGPPLQGSRVQDFGIVSYTGPDMEVAHTFKFTNTTKRTLTIAKVSSSCGCVTPVASTMSLAPGAELELATAMKILHPGKKKEHITIVLEGEDDPIKLDMIAYGRVVMELTSEESEIVISGEHPGALTLLAETSISKMLPLDPYWKDMDGLVIEFAGWTRIDEDDESTTSWKGILNLALDEQSSVTISESGDEEELVITIGMHNELRVPLKVMP